MKAAAVVYQPPKARKHSRIVISTRQAAMLECLRHAACTRLDLLAWGRPWLALSTPQAVASLRRKGLHISTTWETARNADGARARFVRYKLEGRVVRIEGAA